MSLNTAVVMTLGTNVVMIIDVVDSWDAHNGLIVSTLLNRIDLVHIQLLKLLRILYGPSNKLVIWAIGHLWWATCIVQKALRKGKNTKSSKQFLW